MKLLLIGKNGQLGTEIHKQAPKFKYIVYAFGREELDITDDEKIIKVIGKIKPDLIINASAYHVVPECEIYPEIAFKINTVAVKKLAVICRKNDIRFVTYSTDYVFDGLKGKPYIENDKPNPLQIYGLSKLAGEIASLNYNEDVIIIRTCGVYGGLSGSRSKKGNFILSILRDTKDKAILEVSSEQIVSPTYAVDLARATFQLLKNRKAKGIYHLINTGFCSWANFAKEIVRLKNISTEIVPVDRKGMAGGIKRPLFSALKNMRAKKIVLPSWQDALKRYLATL